VECIVSSVDIHPSAVIEKGAQLGVGVKVGPYSHIGSKAILHDRVQVGSHAVIMGRTEIGNETQVWPFASIGTAPQDLKYRGEDARLVIGTHNVFREYSNVSIGTDADKGLTQIGSHNLFMMNVHVAHDCMVGSHCIFANSVSLAGHVHVDDRAVVGGLSGIHQFVKIGAYAMIAGGSMLVQDVPPFVTVQGDRAEASGLNLTGLRRAHFSAEAIKTIRDVYRLIFQAQKTLEDALEDIKSLYPDSPEARMFIDFAARSSRGFVR
jgi:UDP-N-acetylglucosamine acyltransferase